MRLASLNRYINYNVSSKQFSLTDYAAELERRLASSKIMSGSYTMGSKAHPGPTEGDEMEMVDAHITEVSTVDARTAEIDADYVVVNTNTASSTEYD